MAEIDLIKRDPNELNGHIKAAFEDVLGEPDEVHSTDCVWTTAYKCFNGGRNCCYKLMTFLCGICIGLYWGCLFAGIACQHIWCYTPTLRACDITCKLYQKFYTICCNCWLAPCCETLGLFFSRIVVTNK